MKSKKIIVFFIITNIILIGIICSFISTKTNVIKEKQIIKEMSEEEYESSITQLNKSHEDYATQVQTNKKKIAEAITNKGVETSENATTDEIVTNIGEIVTSMKRKLIASNVNNQGTYTSCSDGTKLSDLGTLDITNFACIPKNVSGSGMVSDRGWYTATSSINPSLSYNNGTLSISGLTITSYDGTRQWNTSTVTVDIYVYYCD